MRTLTTTFFAACGLSFATAVLAQAPAPAPANPPQAAAPGGEPGFFRPAADPRLTTITPPAAVPAPAAPQAEPVPPMTPDMAEEARLERIEASMDRIEARNERAVAEANRRAPVIASPMDGTAPILSPLDGTAPLVSGLER